MKGPTSRWLRSEITYGPTGRVVWTVLILAPVIFVVFFSAVFLVAGVIWLFVVPIALRDVWRAVKDRRQPPPIIIPADPQPLRPGESIHDRDVPGRW